jgi:hypothetical protein
MRRWKRWCCRMYRNARHIIFFFHSCLCGDYEICLMSRVCLMSQFVSTLIVHTKPSKPYETSRSPSAQSGSLRYMDSQK